MTNKLIMVVDPTSENYRYRIPGTDAILNCHYTQDAARVVGRDYMVERDFSVYSVSEKHLNNAVQFLCANNPGKTIKVFNQVEEAYVPAGQVIRKKVTNDGAIPF